MARLLSPLTQTGSPPATRPGRPHDRFTVSLRGLPRFEQLMDEMKKTWEAFSQVEKERTGHRDARPPQTVWQG